MDGAEARNDDHGQSYLVELRIGIDMLPSDQSFSVPQERRLVLAFRYFIAYTYQSRVFIDYICIYGCFCMILLAEEDHSICLIFCCWSSRVHCVFCCNF